MYFKALFKSIKKRFYIRNNSLENLYGIEYKVDYNADYKDRKINRLCFHYGKKSLYITLPQIIKPAVVERSSRESITAPRRYGFTIYMSDLYVYYGLVNEYDYASVVNKSKRFHLDWKRSRFVSVAILDFDMNTTYEQFGTGLPLAKYNEEKKKLPMKVYKVVDYDGTHATMTVQIEREIRLRGRGKFEWVSMFTFPIVHVRILLTFDTEMGVQKNHWKGGSRGGVFDLHPNETYEEAIARFFKEPSIANFEFSKIKLAE